MTRSQDPRAFELLADRALYGLDEAELAELRALGADPDETFELAAAAIDLATLPIEPMPAAVAARVAVAAGSATTMAAAGRAGIAGVPGIATTARAFPAPAVPVSPEPTAPVTRPRTLVGWAMPTTAPPVTPMTPRTRRWKPAMTWFATAASILIVAGVSWWLLRGHPEPAAPTVAQGRAELLASAADATQIRWQATREVASASGDLVWSTSMQRGYLRFVGLPANDPKQAQYQLWIFDRLRDQAFPVDGGVFDVTAGGEVIVPIVAKLHVDDATLFAVTIERPGGVVVSKREHIVVTAARS